MNLTMAEKRLKFLMQIWIVCFLGVAMLFLFWGIGLLDFMNQLSAKLFPSLLPLQLIQEKFWLALVESLMITLVYLCFMVQKDIRYYFNFMIPLLISKFTSTFFFFMFFLVHQRSAAYFLGTLIDGTVFLITYYFYSKVKMERQLQARSHEMSGSLSK